MEFPETKKPVSISTISRQVSSAINVDHTPQQVEAEINSLLEKYKKEKIPFFDGKSLGNIVKESGRAYLVDKNNVVYSLHLTEDGSVFLLEAISQPKKPIHIRLDANSLNQSLRFGQDLYLEGTNLRPYKGEDGTEVEPEIGIKIEGLIKVG